MPFRPTDGDSFTKGFTEARGFDKISFRDGKLVLGKTLITELKVKGPLDSFFYRTPETITRVLDNASSAINIVGTP